MRTIKSILLLGAAWASLMGCCHVPLVDGPLRYNPYAMAQLGLPRDTIKRKLSNGHHLYITGHLFLPRCNKLRPPSFGVQLDFFVDGKADSLPINIEGIRFKAVWPSDSVSARPEIYPRTTYPVLVAHPVSNHRGNLGAGSGFTPQLSRNSCRAFLGPNRGQGRKQGFFRYIEVDCSNCRDLALFGKLRLVLAE
jgi:hypothetical protein